MYWVELFNIMCKNESRLTFSADKPEFNICYLLQELFFWVRIIICIGYRRTQEFECVSANSLRLQTFWIHHHHPFGGSWDFISVSNRQINDILNHLLPIMLKAFIVRFRHIKMRVTQSIVRVVKYYEHFSIVICSWINNIKK